MLAILFDGYLIAFPQYEESEGKEPNGFCINLPRTTKIRHKIM